MHNLRITPLGRTVLPVLLCLSVAVSYLTAVSSAWASPNDASRFLEELQDTVLTQLTDADLALAEREARARQLFHDSADLEAIGRFIIGRYWRGASETDRQDFLRVFEDAMMQRFLPFLAEYNGPRFKVGRAREDTQSKATFIVPSRIEREGGEPFHVDWRIRWQDGRFRILDVIAEGVSMAITLRSEYGAVIQSSGGKLSVLTDRLRELVEQDAFAPPQPP